MWLHIQPISSSKLHQQVPLKRQNQLIIQSSVRVQKTITWVWQLAESLCNVLQHTPFSHTVSEVLESGFTSVWPKHQVVCTPASYLGDLRFRCQCRDCLCLLKLFFGPSRQTASKSDQTASFQISPIHCPLHNTNGRYYVISCWHRL